MFIIAQTVGTEPEFYKFLLSLGVGGAIAALIFYFYRKDVKQFTELWKIQSETLIKVVQDNTASNVRLIASIDMHQGLLYQIMGELQIRRKTDKDRAIEEGKEDNRRL